MAAPAEKPDARLREWKPETAAEAKARIAEVLEFADRDALDIRRSRAVEQEVLHLLDDRQPVMRSEIDNEDLPGEGPIERVGELARNGIESYLRCPVLRMLVKLYPPLSIAEAGILGAYQWFQYRRLEVFGDEFTTLKLSISEEEAKRKEFFDAYTSTVRHVLNESRDAKIRLFARLLGGFVRNGCSMPIDRYEELLLLLDEISEREFKLLVLLDRYETKYPMERDGNRLKRANRLWAEFGAEAHLQLGIDEDSLGALLTRLQRTGMYKEITGAYLDYTGGRGHLTTSFADFLDALGLFSETPTY